MDENPEALRDLVGVLDAMKIPYMVGGSVALGVWASPRTTHDLDVVVDLPLTRIEEFCSHFPTDRYYIDPQAMTAAFRQPNSPSLGMYSFTDMLSGFKIDLFPLRPTDAAQVASFSNRVTEEILENQFAAVCSAADLLIQKLRWHTMSGSERQFRDCLNLLLVDKQRQQPHIDWQYVEAWVNRLGPAVQQAWAKVKATFTEIEMDQPTP